MFLPLIHKLTTICAIFAFGGLVVAAANCTPNFVLPTQPDELARIQAMGGLVVLNCDTPRVRGILAMSRALGMQRFSVLFLFITHTYTHSDTARTCTHTTHKVDLCLYQMITTSIADYLV
jgi:hypothetical protein